MFVTASRGADDHRGALTVERSVAAVFAAAGTDRAALTAELDELRASVRVERF